MPLTGKSADEIATLEQELLDRIPENESIGNQSLRESARLPDDLYLAVRNRLRDSGQITIGPGRGGSIRKTNPDEPSELVEHTSPDARAFESDDPFSTEESLYAPMLEVLEKRWVRDQPFDSSVVEITARGGRRPDGTWARPDLTCAAMTSYTFLPGKFLDVITFEVKPYSGVDLTAVYEALSHRRAATRSYVLLHVPDSKLAALQTVLSDICEEASRHGIGVVVAGSPGDFDTWDFREDAVRTEADPYRLNRFIQTQLSQGTRDQILKWLK
jgi:hypothetical protein